MLLCIFCLGVGDRVVHSGADGFGGGDTASDLHGLDGLETHDRLCEQTVEPLVPVGVRANARRQAVRDDLEDAADGVSGTEDLIDFTFHALLGLGIDAVEKNGFFLREINEILPYIGAVKLCLTDADDVRQDFDAEFAEKHLGERSASDARRGFTRRSAFEDVACIGKVILQGARKIGVAGTRRGHRLMLFGIAGLDGQDLFPVLPVAVGDLHGNRRTDGFAMAYAGEDMGCIAFDAHAPATSVALLATPEFVREKLLVDGNTCGETAEEGDERLTVALTSCRKSKHFYPLPKEKL